jgi:hypothetical protein
MMRKLLVLMLVLGMASAANAVLIQVNGQTGAAIQIDEAAIPATITVVGEDTSAWLGYLIVEDGGAGALSNPVMTGNAGDLGASTAYSEDGWGAGYELTVASKSVPTNVAAGALFDLDYTAVLGDTAQITLFIDPDYEVPVASVAVEVVPEPMTVLLLGLGGLFLRRRK